MPLDINFEDIYEFDPVLLGPAIERQQTHVKRPVASDSAPACLSTKDQAGPAVLVAECRLLKLCADTWI